MNLLVLVVLLALAWYSFEAGLTFFAFLVFLAAVLMVFTQQQERQAVHYAQPQAGLAAPGQPIVIESPPGHEKAEVHLKVKKWKDRWIGHPNEYLFYHTGIAVQNIGRSILYLFGIEKDKK